MLLCANVVDRFGLARWLADNRRMRAFSPEDQLWIMQNAVPQILAGPLQRMATLVSQDVAHVEAMAHIVERAGQHDLALCDFKDEEAAVKWLMEEL